MKKWFLRVISIFVFLFVLVGCDTNDFSIPSLNKKYLVEAVSLEEVEEYFDKIATEKTTIKFGAKIDFSVPFFNEKSETTMDLLAYYNEDASYYEVSNYKMNIHGSDASGKFKNYFVDGKNYFDLDLATNMEQMGIEIKQTIKGKYAFSTSYDYLPLPNMSKLDFMDFDNNFAFDILINNEILKVYKKGTEMHLHIAFTKDDFNLLVDSGFEYLDDLDLVNIEDFNTEFLYTFKDGAFQKYNANILIVGSNLFGDLRFNLNMYSIANEKMPKFPNFDDFKVIENDIFWPY